MQDIIKKINNKLKPSGWYDQLAIFLESPIFSDIITELKRKVEEDRQRFCPSLGEAFRFMETVPLDNIKCVILVDYTCNLVDQSCGIPLATGRKKIKNVKRLYMDLTPVYLFQSIDNNAHDADRWVQQGVLMIPLSLTTRIEGRPHKKIWQPLIMRIIESVNRKYPHIPWILLGSDTWKYAEDIRSPHRRQIELKNPIDDHQWPQWVNSVLNKQRKELIRW